MFHTEFEVMFMTYIYKKIPLV